MSSSRESKRTSDILAALVSDTDGDGDISVQEIVRLLGDRAYGLAILVFSLPNSLPIPSPPGFSAITGIPILLIALQLAAGRSTPWLPPRVRKYRFSRAKFASFLNKALPYIRKAERLLHPRLDFMHTWMVERIIGIVFVLLAGLLAMPIPFGNFLPGLSMSLIALGMLERDGALMIAGIMGGVAGAVFILFALGAVTAFVAHLLHIF